MPSDATTPEQPARPSVGDADADDSTGRRGPLTRRQLREAAARRAAERVGDASETPLLDSDAADARGESLSNGDAFDAAAKALKFVGETAGVAERTDAVLPAEEPAKRGVIRRGTRKRRIMTTATASLSAMAAVGLLAIGITTPLGALLGADHAAVSTTALSASAKTSDADDEEIQAFVAADDAAAPSLDRIDDYETASFADMAESAGIDTSGAFFTNDPTADIQWPFAVGTGMSYGYGMRSGRMHQGIDFTPGNGAPIQAIADGTVRVATESGGGYGVHVYIDHVIDGEVITSHYGHMQYGSLRVTAGQKVEVGDVIGLVGDTGHSFGAHAHVELLKGGATFDPLPWFEKYAGTHYEDSGSRGDDVEFAGDDGE